VALGQQRRWSEVRVVAGLIGRRRADQVGVGVEELHKMRLFICLFIIIPWTKSGLFTFEHNTVFFLKLYTLYFMVYLIRSASHVAPFTPPIL
jgi:hypothetical protein